MYCKFCGKEIADDSVFCQYCGKSLVDTNKYNSQKKNWTKHGILKNKKIIIILGSVLVLALSFVVIRNNTTYGKWYNIQENHIVELHIHMNGSWECVVYNRDGNNVYRQGRFERDGQYMFFDKEHHHHAVFVRRGLLNSFVRCNEDFGYWVDYEGVYYERHFFRPKFQ